MKTNSVLNLYHGACNFGHYKTIIEVKNGASNFACKIYITVLVKNLINTIKANMIP